MATRDGHDGEGGAEGEDGTATRRPPPDASTTQPIGAPEPIDTGPLARPRGHDGAGPSSRGVGTRRLVATTRRGGDADEVPAGTPRIARFLQLLEERGGSDLHLSVGRQPMIRLHGEMEPVRYHSLGARDFDHMLRAVTPDRVWRRFRDTGDVDFAFDLAGGGRFRVNLFRQVHGAGAVFRLVPSELPAREQLGLPASVFRLAELDHGLVLVTGPSGSGKTTTLSGLIDLVNERRGVHVLTIEDPIEYVHPPKRALVTQREVGTSAASFSEALRSALREDPDVILVGEMRDLETMQLALMAAETGLLVFGSMHTNSAAKAIDRMVTAFPSDEQDMVRATLSDNLAGVVAQQLVRRRGGGRVAAAEVLLGSPALGMLIREGKTHQITGLMSMGRQQGMVTMDDALLDLVRTGAVEPGEAFTHAIDKTEFRRRLTEHGARLDGLWALDSEPPASDPFPEGSLPAGLGSEEAR